MADLKISQLTDGGASQATDEYVIARSGANYRIDGASVAAAATSVGTLTSLTVSGNTTLGQEVFRGINTGFMRVAGGNPAANGALLYLFGDAHATTPGEARLEASGTSGKVLFLTNSQIRATLDASGNLGLGVTPSDTVGYGRALDVGSGTGAALYLRDTDSPTTKYGFIAYDGIDDGLKIQNQNSTGIIRFGTNGTERARITPGGYFKASDAGTYLGSTGAYHELRGGSANGYTCIVSSPVASPASQYVLDLRFSAATPNDTNARFWNCEDATATRAYMRSNGGLSNYQSNNTDLSDIRTKTDITPAASMWDKVAALEIVAYKYIDQTHDDVNLGVIAQQVETVEPVWVDSDGFGETPEGEEPFKTVYTKDITFAAIKALQEAMARIEALEVEVAALKANA